MVTATKEQSEHGNEEVNTLGSVMIPVIVGRLPRTERPIAVGFIRGGPQRRIMLHRQHVG